MNSKTDYELPEVEPSSFTGCPHCVEGYINVGGVLRDCECRARVLTLRRLRDSGIPARYRSLTMANLRQQKSLQPLSNSVLRAIEDAQEYVANYSEENEPNGLLLIGPLSIGSMLAIAIANDLIEHRRILSRYFEWKPLFIDYNKAKKDANNEAEKAIYASLDRPDLVVLNGLGSTAVREFGWDRVNMLFSTRYNDRLPIIATTTHWNYPSTVLDKRGIDFPGYHAKRLTLADQIGERARSRIAESSKIVQFNEVDPYSLSDIYRLCELTSYEKGWKMPIFVERARSFRRPAVEVRVDEYGHVYLASDDHSKPITNLELFRKIRFDLNRRGQSAPQPESAAYIQPMNIPAKRYHEFLPVTGALISEPDKNGDRTLTLTPFSREIPDLGRSS